MVQSVSMQSNYTSNIENAKKQKQKTNVKGMLLANLAQSGASLAQLPVALLAVKGLTKQSGNLTVGEIVKTNAGVEKALKKVTNLADKGVEIIDFKSAGINLSSLPDWFIDCFNGLSAVAHGKNAAFVPPSTYEKKKIIFDLYGIKPNSIIINKDKLPLASFHEIGHAINYNCSGFWKTMQKARGPLMLVSGLLAMIPAFTKEIKPQEGEELTKGQKIKNGIRKASPFMAMGAMLPMVAEEAMATIRGNKLAKQVLDGDLAKKVAKTNKWGLISYTITALIAGLSAKVAMIVKDKSDEKMRMEMSPSSFAQTNCHQA